MSSPNQFKKELDNQVDRSREAVALIKIVSDLWYDKSVELVFFRNKLLNLSVSEILDLHHYAAEFVNKPISVFDLVDIAKGIQNLNLPPAKIDVGKLTHEFLLQNENDAYYFVAHKFAQVKSFNHIVPKDVILYGFGRIGRLLARELMTGIGQGTQLRLRAIVTRGSINRTILEKRAALLRRDSIHRHFPGTVTVDVKNKALIINGTTVFVISANNPQDIDYTRYGIRDALILDNTGAYRTKEALGRHLKAKGASKVLLTAPGKKGVPNIVYGVNQKNYDPDKIDIFSAASCTTNAITPVLKIIEERLGIEYGHLETIHAYTNDQNLVDNIHKKYRRGRAAALNMVITETGAGSAVAEAYPALQGKLSSNAIRVPVPNGSLAILNLNLKKTTREKEVNTIVKKYALEGELVNQIKFSADDELVSSDIVGSSAPAIFDSKATKVANEGRNVVLYVWYDNEYGYSHQVIRLAKYIAKVRRFTYY